MAIKIQGTTVIDDSKNVLVGNGSESAPSITAVADIDTGIYFPEANVVALTTDGKQRLKADANGITAVITPQSSVPWTFSARTSDDLLSIFNNVVHPYEVVFVPDLTTVSSGTTYTVEASGQLIPLWYEISGIQYNSNINGWEPTKRSIYDIIDQYSVQTVYNKTIASPTITAPTINNATITAPTINNATITAPTINNATISNGLATNFNITTGIFNDVASMLALCHSNVLEGHAVIPENTNSLSILPISIPDGTYVIVGSGSTWNFLNF